VNERARALCPICKTNGIKFGGSMRGLAGHLEEGHTINDLVRTIVNDFRVEDEAAPPTCAAHNDTDCDLCTLNPADCAADGSCDMYLTTGMHWDSCPNRIRSYADAVARLHRVDGGPQFGIVYKFGREGDPCPECGGFNGRHNQVFDEHDWGTDCRRCSYNPDRPVHE
jgi:hypothetical protein